MRREDTSRGIFLSVFRCHGCSSSLRIGMGRNRQRSVHRTWREDKEKDSRQVTENASLLQELGINLTYG